MFRRLMKCNRIKILFEQFVTKFHSKILYKQVSHNFKFTKENELKNDKSKAILKIMLFHTIKVQLNIKLKDPFL